MLKKDKKEALEIRKSQLLDVYGEFYLLDLKGVEQYPNTMTQVNVKKKMKNIEVDVDIINKELNRLSKGKKEKIEKVEKVEKIKVEKIEKVKKTQSIEKSKKTQSIEK